MELNLVVCSLATFAAGVGYAYTRRMSAGSLNKPSEKFVDMDEKTTTFYIPSSDKPSRRPSLKRKNTEDHYPSELEDSEQALGYPHNLNHIYPRANKRSRTPSTESVDGDEVALFERCPVVEEPPVQEAASQLDDETSHEPEQPVSTTPEEPSASCTDPEVPVVENTANEPRAPSPTPAPGSPDNSASPVPPSADSDPVDDYVLVEAPPRLPTPPPVVKPLRGFAAFAGKGNAFSAGTKSESKPVWAVSSATGGDVLGQPNENTVVAFSSAPSADLLKKDDVSKAAARVTGEEDEDVRDELKNLKLYIKRGKAEFSAEGMTGTLKLLVDKTTGQERLLFRRDPLWQVTMNTWIAPSIRCVYSVNEHVLRVITSETVGTISPTREVTIYAIKAGRGASKDQFHEFAQKLVQHEKLTSS